VNKLRLLFVFKSVEWLGVEYLSSSLQKAGHETDLAFESGLEGTFYFKAKKKSHLDILKKIDTFKPDVILFSSTTNLFSWVKEVALQIKQKYNLPIIAGGIHPTIQPDKVIAEKDIDIICIGEGEEAIVELANKMEKKQDYTKTKNLWFKKDGKIIKNPVRPLLKNLDLLPNPDKDIFYKYGCFTDRVYLMTSRGCPYKCTYCFNHQIQNLYKDMGIGYFRRRSLNLIIDELKAYIKKYKIKSVHFYDDTFILDKNWVLKFAEEYKKEIGLPFYCLVRANLVDSEIIKALKSAGCKAVSMGVESGNEYIRNILLKRNMQNEEIVNAARIIKENKIKLITFNIFGFPGETPEQMLDTMKINLQIKPDSLFTYVFYPFPGTDLMKIALEKKFIDQNVYQKIMEGAGDYQSESLLNHPFKEVAYNMKVILPLLNKFPKSTHSYFLSKWVYKRHSKIFLSMLKIVAIPFYSSWESKQRLKEQISMLKIHYKNKLFNRVL